MRISVAEAARALGIEPPDSAAEASFTGACIDSRKVRPGNLFVCLRGERADGHDYAKTAIANGAAAILAERPVSGVEAPALLVPNAAKALAKLAAWVRAGVSANVVCVTGTAGKTTLKEALKAILSRVGKTAATEKNHNNQIGMPLAILNTDGDEDYWILEAGISRPGDMDELGAIAKPDLALVLNAGPGHCEGLGEKGVAWHKARLLRHLAPGGMGLICADYPDLVSAASEHRVPLAFFSASEAPRAEFKARPAKGASGAHELDLRGEKLVADTPFPGGYGAELASAAAACAFLLGAGAADIQQGFREIHLPEQRFSRLQAGDWLIFDDTYNANPLSMRRMLEAAAGEAAAEGLPFAMVLGEMGELGPDAPAYHRDLGAFAASLMPVAVFWKGGFLEDFRQGLGQEGKVMAATSPEEFVQAWRDARMPGRGAAIFKGSRSNRLEDWLGALKRDLTGVNGDVL